MSSRVSRRGRIAGCRMVPRCDDYWEPRRGNPSEFQRRQQRSADSRNRQQHRSPSSAASRSRECDPASTRDTGETLTPARSAIPPRESRLTIWGTATTANANLRLRRTLICRAGTRHVVLVRFDARDVHVDEGWCRSVADQGHWCACSCRPSLLYDATLTARIDPTPKPGVDQIRGAGPLDPRGISRPLFSTLNTGGVSPWTRAIRVCIAWRPCLSLSRATVDMVGDIYWVNCSSSHPNTLTSSGTLTPLS